MEKTEQMYRFEQETGREALVTVPLEGDSLLVVSEEYTRWQEAKSEAYDRLMIGGKKTLKEWANITGRVVVISRTGTCLLSIIVPHIGYCGGLDTWDYNYEDYPLELPRELVDFTGDWKDSLTLPDGWES